jgi:nickel/cobalt transporter (NicO) family protein
MDVSTVYFPSAVALGALHALEPGHAKTLTAAYLIGTKGTKGDAVLLGLSVALTHSIVVVGLSVGAVWLGREAFTDEASRWLAVFSGAIVVVLGVWLLRKRIRVTRRAAHIGVHLHEHGHSHAPDPQPIKGRLASGIVEIIDTPAGERLRLTLDAAVSGLSSRVDIFRDSGRTESLSLTPQNQANLVWLSDVPPDEPHEFKANVVLISGAESEELPFEVHEPEDHHHNHDHMTDDEHARAHAATLPSYVADGGRPTPWQVMAFGGAGGLIPCPAAVTVMLLSLSVAKSANGLFLVAGFSLGLAITLVGVGLAVVMGLSKLAGTGRLSWLSKQAPVISASLVILSGAIGLTMAIVKGH